MGDGKCHKTTPKGPFMGDDLVSCSKTKPAEEEDAGLSWAGIEPPLPAESCPKPSAACTKSAKACDANKQCAAAKAKGGTKGIVDVGCHGGKGGLNAFFAWAADCCDPSHIGFSDNIPMFKMQITSMPVYKNSGTNGRFKANRGAGSVCTMVKSLAAGMASGDDGGVFLQKSSFKEVKAKHAAANKADNAAHAASNKKTATLHKGLVKAVVSHKSTKAANKAAGANSKAAGAAAKAEAHWAKKEAGFRAKARALNKKQRAAAKSMEGGVKSARKKLMADTAKSIVAMHKAAVAEKALMKKHAAFQKSMHALQKKMAHESAAAKAASGRRLAKYKKEMAANAKAIAAGKAKSAAIANAMKAANAKLAKDQAGINAHYKATMKALSAKNAANQKAFNAAAEKSQKSFAAKFAGNKAAADAARAAIAASVKAANKEAAAKTARINKRHAAEQAAKHKADAAYAKKAAADAAALRKSRAATAEKFAKVAAKADAAFEKDMQEAGQKKAKADRAAAQEKASKKTAEKNSKADEKETKASEASDEEIKECAIDGSECQTKDGKCHKTTPKGPFMGDDLVSCSKTKPAEEEDAGLGWAGIEPPLPAESCPKPDAACKAAAKACDADGSCKKAKAKGGTKGIVDVGCHGGKKGLNAFFAWSSACCDPKNIGFSDNIPMFKMQITAMPVYKNSGTNGRFKANRGAGSVCTMVKSLASGMASGDDGGVFLQKSSMKEVKAKHAAANKADNAAHAASNKKTATLHKGLVK